MRVFCLAGVIAVGWIGMAQASLYGDTVHIYLEYPTKQQVIVDDGNVVVGSGLEYSLVNFNIDFQPTQIIIQNKNGTTFAQAAFNGYEISDLTHPFTSVSLNSSSTIVDFTSSNLSFVNGAIFANFAGLSATPGQTVVLDVNASDVPEPASAALFGLGLAGIAAVRRRGSRGRPPGSRYRPRRMRFS